MLLREILTRHHRELDEVVRMILKAHGRNGMVSYRLAPDLQSIDLVQAEAAQTIQEEKNGEHKEKQTRNNNSSANFI